MAENAPCCTLTNAELVAKAREWITSLCQTGGRSWSLRVPVDLDRDPDMIFEELCIRLSHGCPCREPEPAKDTDLNVCPNCGGPADNGFDRCVPPNPYYCTKCDEAEQKGDGDVQCTPEA